MTDYECQDLSRAGDHGFPPFRQKEGERMGHGASAPIRLSYVSLLLGEGDKAVRGDFDFELAVLRLATRAALMG